MQRPPCRSQPAQHLSRSPRHLEITASEGAQFAPIGRRYHTKENLAEVAAVFSAELDYGREAEMTDTFRHIHEGDADVVVPRVVHSLTTRRVLTGTGEDGAGYSLIRNRKLSVPP